MTNVCLGFTQLNHNRKKQPSCQQKIMFWNCKKKEKEKTHAPLRFGTCFTHRFVLHLVGATGGKYIQEQRSGRIYITISQKDARSDRLLADGLKAQRGRLCSARADPPIIHNCSSFLTGKLCKRAHRRQSRTPCEVERIQTVFSLVESITVKYSLWNDSVSPLLVIYFKMTNSSEFLFEEDMGRKKACLKKSSFDLCFEKNMTTIIVNQQTCASNFCFCLEVCLFQEFSKEQEQEKKVRQIYQNVPNRLMCF